MRKEKLLYLIENNPNRRRIWQPINSDSRKKSVQIHRNCRPINRIIDYAIFTELAGSKCNMLQTHPSALQLHRPSGLFSESAVNPTACNVRQFFFVSATVRKYEFYGLKNRKFSRILTNMIEILFLFTGPSHTNNLKGWAYNRHLKKICTTK